MEGKFFDVSLTKNRAVNHHKIQLTNGLDGMLAKLFSAARYKKLKSARITDFITFC
jgi:hypothetical protein